MIAKTIVCMISSWAGITLAQAASGVGVEDALHNATAQVPALVVLVVLAIFFLRALENKDRAFANAQAAKDKEFAEAAARSRQDYLDSLKSLMASHQAQWSALHADQLEARKETHQFIERQIETTRLMSAAIAGCPAKGHQI